MAGRGFLDWWTAELNRLVPSSSDSRKLDELRFKFSTLSTTIELTSRGRTEELMPPVPVDTADIEDLDAVADRLGPGKRRIVCDIDPALLLSRSVSLPFAAEENLRDVLGFEMERQTPFRAGEVHFDYQVSARNDTERQLDVQLYLVPRKSVRLAEELGARWDLTSGTLMRNAGRYQVVYSPRVTPEARRFSRFLLAANVILLAAVIVVPIGHQRMALKRLQAELETARQGALLAAETMDQVETVRSRLEFLHARKSSRVPMVEVIDEISRLLPDTTWLVRLEIKDDTLHLRGYSRTASALIARIDNAERFTQTRFASPVTKEDATANERFYIVTSIADTGPQG